MAVDDVAEVSGETLELALEALVLEGYDLAAVAADEVVMVLTIRMDRLVAGDAAAEVDALHEPE